MIITPEDVDTMVGTWRRETGFILDSGNGLPLLLGNGFSTRGVRAFLIQFDGYVERLPISNLGGRERRVVSIRELLSRSLVEMLGDKDSFGEEFTDDAIRETLRMFASECEQYGLVEETHNPVHAREADLDGVLA